MVNMPKPSSWIPLRPSCNFLLVNSKSTSKKVAQYPGMSPTADRSIFALHRLEKSLKTSRAVAPVVGSNPIALKNLSVLSPSP